MKLTTFEQRILDTWEEVYKKGQLTLWILLSLKHQPKHMTAIKKFITRATNNSLSADDQSMYRALRRFAEMELITYREIPSTRHGPDLKVYSLTATGARVLNTFIKKNVTAIFYKKKIKKLLNNQ